MSRASSHLRRLTAAVALAVPSLAAAQAPASTGVVLAGGQDQRWDVSVNGSAFFDAFLATTVPGVWQSNTAAYAWIAAQPNATVGAPSSYTFRTMFDVNGPVGSTTLVFRCAVDNRFLGYNLNGVAVAGAACGTQGNGFQFGPTQTVTSGFVSGQNTLEFFMTGDGTTDGIVVSIDAFESVAVAVVPEPATVALTGGGLLALAGIGLRRRRA